MPLRCFSNSGEIRAFDESSETWMSLKASYKSQDLRMVCCGTPAIPKTSSLGTFFFAHSRRGECTSAPETKEHLLAKTIIAKAVIAAGWKVTTECRGNTDDGKIWIADVLAEHGKAKVAFEVQWSAQTDEDTTIRQQIYDGAGIRALWLFKLANFKSSKETPAFRLIPNNPLDGFNVKIPKNDTFFDGRHNFHWSQEIELSDFIKGSLSKRLVWSLAPGTKLPVRFDGVSIKCWKCKQSTTILLRIVFELGKKFPGCDELMVSIYEFEKHQEILKSLIPRDLYTKHGVGIIKKRFSKTVGHEYISNGCARCDAIQGQHFEHELGHDAAAIMSTEAELTEPLLSVLTGERQDLSHWYFNP